jgi:hypothetical protein
LEIGFWNLGFCPSLPWGKFYDIAQHVILPFQDAKFMGRATRLIQGPCFEAVAPVGAANVPLSLYHKVSGFSAASGQQNGQSNQ